MLSHDLAKLLLAGPNFPIATHALNHTYMSKADAISHGPVKVGKLETRNGSYIIIGNMHYKDLGMSNCHITDMYHGEIPK